MESYKKNVAGQVLREESQCINEFTPRPWRKYGSAPLPHPCRDVDILICIWWLNATFIFRQLAFWAWLLSGIKGMNGSKSIGSFSSVKSMEYLQCGHRGVDAIERRIVFAFLFRCAESADRASVNDAKCFFLSSLRHGQEYWWPCGYGRLTAKE